MEKEIEMLGRQKGKLEERILELYDIVETNKSSLADAQATQKRLEDELAAHLEKIHQDAAILTAQDTGIVQGPRAGSARRESRFGQEI